MQSPDGTPNAAVVKKAARLCFSTLDFDRCFYIIDYTVVTTTRLSLCASSGTIDADEFALFMSESEFGRHLTTADVKERFQDLIPPDR